MDTKKSQKVIQVKPMRYYKNRKVKLKDVKEGDVVVAEVVICIDENILLKIGDTAAKMPLEDYYGNDKSKEPPKIYPNIGKRILVRVKSIEDTCVIVEHKSVVEESIKLLIPKLGENILVTIESISEDGLLVDIGNGIMSLVSMDEIFMNEISKRRHFLDLHKIFKKGESIKVYLMSYYTRTKSFEVSRRRAYKKISFEKGDLVHVKCEDPLENQSGIYVEYDPGNFGIMDVPEGIDLNSFSFGEDVVATIHKNTEKGFRCTFLSK